MSDYRVKVGVRNARLLRAIEATGLSVMAFCKQEQLNYQAVSDITRMTSPPINQRGEFTPLAAKLMEALGALPQELWSAKQLNEALPRSTMEVDVSEDQIQGYIEHRHNQELTAKLLSARTISERDRKCVEARSADVTLEELGRRFDVSRERVRDIEAIAHRKMRKTASLLGIGASDGGEGDGLWKAKLLDRDSPRG